MRDPVSTKTLGQRLGRKRTWCSQLVTFMQANGYEVAQDGRTRLVSMEDVPDALERRARLKRGKRI